jgi:hypothetical protein
MKSVLMLLLLLSLNVSARAVSYLPGYCGAYASVIRNGSVFDVYSNATNQSNAKCPGSGCPGIVKYSGPLNKLVYKGVVIPNSVINDVYLADGVTLDPGRMFSRPVIARDGLCYILVSMVGNYNGGTLIPAMSTSSDGVNWNYLGKFKGEPESLKIFGSGMALIVSNTSPRYRFYTDGYGPSVAQLYSDGYNQWKFVRNTSGTIRELKPPQWTGAIFHSVAELNGVYYMAASNKWPVTQWEFAHSTNGIDWVHEAFVNVGSYHKNVSLFTDNGTVNNLATTYLSGSNCYRKTLNP